MNQPLVSIGFPLFQGGADVERALGLLLSQTHESLEVIVSDNASSDDGGRLARAAAEQDARVRYQRLLSTVPAPENFRMTVEAARGRYFMWAAHDDAWEPDHVSRLVALLEADEDAVLAAPLTHDVDAQGRTVRVHHRALLHTERSRAARLASYVEQPEAEGKANLIYGLFRRDALARVQPMRLLTDTRLTDYHAILAMLVEGPMVADPNLVFRKRLHPHEIEPAREGKALASTRSFVQDLRRTLAWLAGYERVLDARELPEAELRLVRSTLRRRRLREITKAGAGFGLLAFRRLRRDVRVGR